MLLELNNVMYSNGNFRLGPLNTLIPEGKITSIMGQNGSGKTTTLKILHGDLKSSSGHAILDGIDVFKYKPLDLARKTSFIAQETYNPLNLTVRDVMEVSGYARDFDESAMIDALDIFHLGKFLYRDFNMISGGEKKLVTIAASIYQGSDIIIMDEPTNFLDVDNQVLVYNVMNEFCRKGKTIITATHDISAVSAISDYVIMLKNGGIVDQGNTSKTLTVDNLKKVFNVPFMVYNTGHGIIFSTQFNIKKQ